MSADWPSGLAHDPWARSAPPAAVTRGEQLYQHALTVSLALLGTFLPFSVAGTSISMAALLVLAVLAAPRLWRLAPWRQPVIAAGLVLFAWIAVRIVIEPVNITLRVAALNRYHELLMIPILWGLLRIAHHPDALWRGLLAGTFAYAAAHWAVPWWPELASWLEPRRISGGLVFAVCAFLLVEYGRARPAHRELLWGGAVFLLGTAFFASDARTGHVLAMLMMGLAAWRAAPRKYRLVAALLVVLAATCLALLSPSVRGRIAETLEAAEAERSGIVAASSSGYRLQVWRHGTTVARDHALLGVGWANYRKSFESKAMKPGQPDEFWMHTDNPHNEYLMQLGAGGVLALGLFLVWLGMPLAQAWRARRTPQPWPPLVACLSIAFAAGCVANSLLLDFGGGHIHAALLAWLLARQEA